MLDLMHLAALNTLRNARRSAITILSIGVGCAALAAFGAFISFTFEGLRETTIRTQLGHMQIYANGYWEKHVADPGGVLIHDPAPLLTELEQVEGVSSVTHRLTFSGVGGIGKAAVNISVTGVDPAREGDFADFETVVSGRNLLPGDTEAGVIGQELARGIGAGVGDWVTVMTTSLDGIINAVDFEVVGIVRTGSVEYDSVFAKVPIGLAQRALETDAVERVIVLLDDTAALDRIAPQIESVLAAQPNRYETRRWSDLAGFYEAVVSLYSGLFRIFTGIVAVVVMFSVANTMTMAVMERMGESGALRAIGARQGTMMTMFLYEGLFIGVLGACVGAVLALALAWGVDLMGGIAMPPPPAMTEGYQAFFNMTPAVLAQAAVIALVAAVLSSIYPAWAASRVNIVEALQKP